MANRLTVIQMISTRCVEDNLIQAEQSIKQAKEQGACMVSLPENFACMALNESDKLAIAEQDGIGPIQQWCAEISQKYGLFLLAGTVPLRVSGQDKIYAASLLFNDRGERVARYDKIHLFDVCLSDAESYRESDAIEPGHQLITAQTPIGCVGLSVCYDVRFAEMYRALTLKGAEIIFVPSAFTQTTGLAHWQTLLQARAIENLVYIAAPNQGGEHPGKRTTYGHSMIINPWGEVLTNAKQQIGPVSTNIDLSFLHQLRQRFPCNLHHVLS